MKEIISVALWSMEKVINQIIQSDRYVLNKLAPFAGRSLEIETRSPNFSIVVFFGFDRLSLSGMNAEALNVTPDAKVSGEAKALVNLLTKNTSQTLTNSRIAVAGDAQFMQDIFQAIQSLDIQWADHLAPFLGDTVTHETDNFVRSFSSWSQDAGKKLKRNANDYIKEEARLAPHSSDIQKFREDLDHLRLKIDRVTAKAEYLFQRLGPVNN